VNDETRTLRWAREVWRETPIGEHEVRAGADRIARRFAVRRRALSAHRVWVLSGATAAFLGTLAYAGRSTWIEPSGIERKSAVGEHAPVEVPIAPPPIVAPAAAATEEPIPAIEAPPAASIARREARSVRAPEPTWLEVSDSLAEHDQDRAEKLLLDLAARGHDANTRAKALLGLAQLDEARDDCAAARSHALKAASMPDIEMKTVRRALELAARCTR
jgi:hypothetical protein